MIFTTKPNYISFIYFNLIYKIIINFLEYKKNDVVLDFGCGIGLLKKKIKKKYPEANIINYDKVKSLSEVSDWKNINFNKIIFCQVLMYISKEDIENIFYILKKKKIDKIIICFSKQSFLNRLFAKILGHKNAHDDTVLIPEHEEKLIYQNFKILKKINFFNLFKIYSLSNKS